MSARHSASRLAAWILAVSTLGTSAVAGSERQQPAVLDLVINKVPHGEIVVHIGEGEIWCDVAALERAGLRGFAGDRETRGNRVLVGLRSLAPAVRFELDETALELRLTVAPALFGQTERNILSERPPGIEQQHVPSAFLNYGASLATSGSNAVTIEGGVSARGALLTSTAFSDLAGRFLRGQTSVTVDDQHAHEPLNRRRHRGRNRSTRWERSVGRRQRVAGLLPLPVLRSLSDHRFERRRHDAVARGGVRQRSACAGRATSARRLPVEPAAAAGRNGEHASGRARCIWRQQEFDSSYYISGCVGRGLQQFAYSAGVERLWPFEASWSTDEQPTWYLPRRVTDSVTAGGRFEWRNDLVSGGPSVTTRIGHFGEIETIAAASRTGGRTGHAGSISCTSIPARAGGVAVAVRHMSPEDATFTTLGNDRAAATGRRRIGDHASHLAREPLRILASALVPRGAPDAARRSDDHDWCRKTHQRIPERDPFARRGPVGIPAALPGSGVALGPRSIGESIVRARLRVRLAQDRGRATRVALRAGATGIACKLLVSCAWCGGGSPC